MSRSRKKRAIITQQSKHKKYYKKLANKKVRKMEEIQDGSAYKTVFESWDICDLKIDYTGDKQEDSVKRK